MNLSEAKVAAGALAEVEALRGVTGRYWSTVPQVCSWLAETCSHNAEYLTILSLSSQRVSR